MAEHSVPIRIGQAYGWWTVLHAAGENWDCRCACGTERQLTESELREARRRPLRKFPRGRQNRGGSSSTPEYGIWKNMIRRCEDATHPSYHNYGGRGIEVAPEYYSFDFFLTDLGPRPSPKHSIDRLDPNDNYRPGNVVWGTRHEQARHRRNNRYLTFRGETLVITDWQARTGISSRTIKTRLAQGWSVKKALTTPVPTSRIRKSKKMRTLTLHGETLTVRQWAERIGLCYAALTRRLRAGWDPELALTTPPDPKQSENARKNRLGGSV